MDKILIVDDNKDFCKRFAEILRRRGGFEVNWLIDETRISNEISDEDYNAILLDLDFHGELKGIDIIKDYQRKLAIPPIIVLTDYSDTRLAVTASKLGAFDYLEKSEDIEHIILIIKNAVENSQLRDLIRSKYRIVGKSNEISEVREKIARYAKSDQLVLITGDTGTGKELVARALHVESDRMVYPFISKNCAATPESLVESELFGFEKGTFTGAHASRDGAFIAAGDGTLFLDEIGDMKIEMQAKILRALEDKTITKLGSHEEIPYCAKIITATKHNLKEKIKLGEFREDLFYRLDVLSIHVPSLRERKTDIPELFNHFIALSHAEEGKSIPEIDQNAYGILIQYDWPGNVRELRNIARKLACNLSAPIIEKKDIEYFLSIQGTSQDNSLSTILAKAEKDALTNALTITNGIVKDAADLLGIGVWNFYSKAEKYGISLKDFKSRPVK